jgi:hypothetical protein
MTSVLYSYAWKVTRLVSLPQGGRDQLWVELMSQRFPWDQAESRLQLEAGGVAQMVRAPAQQVWCNEFKSQYRKKNKKTPAKPHPCLTSPCLNLLFLMNYGQVNPNSAVKKLIYWKSCFGFFFFLIQYIAIQPRLALNLICVPGWPPKCWDYRRGLPYLVKCCFSMGENDLFRFVSLISRVLSNISHIFKPFALLICALCLFLYHGSL